MNSIIIFEEDYNNICFCKEVNIMDQRLIGVNDKGTKVAVSTPVISITIDKSRIILDTTSDKKGGITIEDFKERKKIAKQLINDGVLDED